MKQINRPYPGMTDASVEFFVHEEDVLVMHSGAIKSFSELSFSNIAILKDAIARDPEVEAALLELYPESEIKRLKQFAMCRFGGLDREADIKEGVLQDGEFWACAQRGQCDYEGTLCKLPVLNGHRLAKQDLLMMQLLSTGKTNDAVASEIGLAPGTFHRDKKILYEKLRISTRPELAIIAAMLNLI